MRISDWSSDVCSSDLVCAVACPGEPHPGRNGQAAVQARRVAVGTTCGPGHEVRVHWRALLRWVRGSSRGKSWGRIRTGTKVPCFPPLSRWFDLEPPGESKDRKSTRLNSSH